MFDDLLVISVPNEDSKASLVKKLVNEYFAVGQGMRTIFPRV
jgi:hypothetical protein